MHSCQNITERLISPRTVQGRLRRYGFNRRKFSFDIDEVEEEVRGFSIDVNVRVDIGIFGILYNCAESMFLVMLCTN